MYTYVFISMFITLSYTLLIQSPTSSLQFCNTVSVFIIVLLLLTSSPLRYSKSLKPFEGLRTSSISSTKEIVLKCLSK